MKKIFGNIPSRKERQKEKKANVKNQVLSFTVSPNLKKEIEDLKELADFESRSEFLRVCIAINKTLMKHAKEGLTELVIQKPGGEGRKFIHLNHLFKMDKK